jgi:hypothetical protein
LRQDNTGKFTSKVICGITLVTGATAPQKTGNVALTTPDCVVVAGGMNTDTDSSHYLVGFGTVRNVQNIVIKPNSQMINGSPCKGTPTDGDTNMTIPSFYPVQQIMSLPSGTVVALLLGKHPIDVTPTPIATAQTAPQGGWLDYHRYSDGKNPSDLSKSDWLAIQGPTIGSVTGGSVEVTSFFAMFPSTNTDATFMPGDGGGGLYYAEDTGTVSVVGLLSSFTQGPPATVAKFVSVQANYNPIEGAIQIAKDWNDCY